MLARPVLICVLLGSGVLVSTTGPQTAEDPVVVFTQREIARTRTRTYRPSAGFVPDSKTAVAIAIAVLTPIYGEAEIASEKPWHTGLDSGVWTVVGTFNGKGLGGEAVVQIDKKTGEIKFVEHTM